MVASDHVSGSRLCWIHFCFVCDHQTFARPCECTNLLFLFVKLVIHELAHFEGEAFEVHRDVEDASKMKLSPIISISVVRGWYNLLTILSPPSIPPMTNFSLIFGLYFPPCSWLLYEKPGFQGRSIALEEGPTDHIVNVWAEEDAPTTLDQMGQPVPTTPLVIGSIRFAVKVSSDFFLLLLEFCKYHFLTYLLLYTQQ